MAKPLRQWLEEDVGPVRGKSMRWISERYFFRDPNRAVYSDTGFFFPPADGIVLYAKTVAPDESIVNIKGRDFSLREAMRLPDFDRTCLVVGIFMTFYDVHINRMPYAGRLHYHELEPIGTHNAPMLEVEKALLEDIAPYTQNADYLFSNQRVLNTITSLELGQRYYVLQIADYDVDCIMPFSIRQNQVYAQNQRFSQIRYGSQLDLIIPLSARYDFTPLVEVGMHVECAVDPLVRITPRSPGVPS
jgi:phosphatidylserine decarboxylase